MATPPSPDSVLLFKLLEDPEKWYGYYDIKAKIAEKVAPGRAIRKYKQRLNESRGLRGSTPPTDLERSQSEMIRLGAMACAQVALTSWKGKGIMIRGEGEFKEIRLKPGFQPWGLLTDTKTDEDEQDPGKEPEGYTDVPPGDSEPSVPLHGGPQGPSEPMVEPSAVVEPAVESVPDAVVVLNLAAEAVEAEMRAEAEERGEIEPLPGQRAKAPTEQMPAVSLVEPELAQDVDEKEKVDDFDLGPDPEVSSQKVSIYEVDTCPDCGMGIVDMPVHEDWHEQLRRVTASSGSAFIDPETLRTLVDGVMRQALGRFQANMQAWLEGEFAELNRQIRLGGKPVKARTSWVEEDTY